MSGNYKNNKFNKNTLLNINLANKNISKKVEKMTKFDKNFKISYVFLYILNMKFLFYFILINQLYYYYYYYYSIHILILYNK